MTSSPPVSTAATTDQTTRSGRVGLTVIGLVLMAVGSIFTWVLWHSYQRTVEVRDTWTRIDTTINRSEFEEVRDSMNTEPVYEVVIKYSYVVDLVSIDSYRVVRQDASTSPKITRVMKDKAAAEALVEKYKLGKNVPCLVNPKDPKQAVLEFGGIGSIYSIWFPLLFVVGGLGMIINIWMPHPTDKKEGRKGILKA